MGKKNLVRVSVLVLSALCGCSHVESDWQSAEKRDTIQSYSSFVAKYPQGPHAAEAQERLDWLTAKKDDSIEAYAEFDQKHPHSNYHEEITRLNAPRIVPAIQDLATRIRTWTDADRHLVNSILMLDPNNPYALLLLGVDDARQGAFDKAREVFTSAKSSVKDQKISDLALVCPVVEEKHTSALEVVRPPWVGPSADHERELTLHLARAAAARDPRGLLLVNKGQCMVQQIEFGSERSKQLSGALKCWVDFDLKQLTNLAAAAGTPTAPSIITVVKVVGAEQDCSSK